MGNTNCATCSCGQDEELNQLSNLTFSVTKNKRKLEVNDLISAHIKEVLFIQKEIKKFLLRKKEERDPFSKFNHKHSSSIVAKPKDEISSTNESILNNEIKYVEGLRINNAIYTGEILNGKRHGKGTQIWDEGAKYEGEWQNNKANGYGIFYHTDGDVYKGYWVNDQANGEGVYISSDGGRYEGYWIDNVQNGYGTEQWKDGSSYKGNYNMGKKEGFGEFIWANKNKYTGNWVNSKKEGKGSFYFANGNEYTGDFKDSLMEVNGMMEEYILECIKKIRKKD